MYRKSKINPLKRFKRFPISAKFNIKIKYRNLSDDVNVLKKEGLENCDSVIGLKWHMTAKFYCTIKKIFADSHNIERIDLYIDRK